MDTQEDTNKKDVNTFDLNKISSHIEAIRDIRESNGIYLTDNMVIINPNMKNEYNQLHTFTNPNISNI